MPHSAVFDLGPHCLPVTLVGVFRLELVELITLVIIQDDLNKFCMVKTKGMGAY